MMMYSNRFIESYERELSATADQVAVAMFAIDVAESRAAAKAYAQEKEQLDDAISSANEYAAELRESIKDAKMAPDGLAAASALLKGERVENVSAAELQEELDTLLSGLRVLADRRYELNAKHQLHVDPTEPAITAAVEPFVEFFESRFRILRLELAQLYADAQALAYLARRSKLTSVAADASELLDAARLGGRRALDYFPPSQQLHRLADAPCLLHLRRGVSSAPVVPHGRYGG